MTTGIQLACSSLLLREVNVMSALDLIAADGFLGVDLCIIPGVCTHVDPTIDGSMEIEQIRKHLCSLNLKVSSLTVVPGYLNAPNPRKAFDYTRLCIDIAAELGIKIVSIPSGHRVEHDRWRDSAIGVAKLMHELADYAEPLNVELSVEAPHWGTLTDTLAQSVDFFQLLADRRIKATFDTSHVMRGQEMDLPSAIDLIGIGLIDHVHLRDVIGDDISITPGRGHINFSRLISGLIARGYNGWLSLELEYERASQSKARSEARFAKAYIEGLVSDLEMPTSVRLQTLPGLKPLSRAYHFPRQEIKRNPQRLSLLRTIKSFVKGATPVRTLDGYWRDKRYLPRRGTIVVQEPGSVPAIKPISKILKVCIHGSGGAGNYHAHGFQRLAAVNVVGVSDVDPERAQSLGQKIRCKSYTSLREMVEEQHPDIVSVCTREWQHYEPVIYLLEQGINVFCEKILASRYSEAKEMVERARQKNLSLGVNYNYRFMPGVRKLKEIIESRGFGKLELLNIRVHAFSYHHALDLVSFLGGGIKGVYARYINDDAVRPFGGTDWSLYDPDILYVPSKSLAVVLELSNHAITTISSSYFGSGSEFILAIEARFDCGAVSLTGINEFDVVGTLSWSPTGLADKALEYRAGVFARGYEYCFYRSIESFVNAYITGEPPETTGYQGIFNIELEKAIHRSNETGSRVCFPPSTSADAAFQEKPAPAPVTEPE